MDVTGTSTAEAIRDEIERGGPIGFDRFMELALYGPGFGYYTRGRDPFGKGGDFYTAEQLQPVFGILIAQFAASLRARSGIEDFRVVELGAGRGEMEEALCSLSYIAVDVSRGEWPETVQGLVFANEFFDALPVGVAVKRQGEFRELLVEAHAAGFRFVDGPRCAGNALEYVQRYYGEAPDDSVVEIHLRSLDWLDQISAALTGWLLVIDYGYTAREFVRFEAGTLMSYYRHTASPDVLAEPGERDITAHVPFTVIQEELKRRGFEVEKFETLASFLMSIGEADQFEAALRADDERQAMRRRMQLKTLLYGMGETFRVLLASRRHQ